MATWQNVKFCSDWTMYTEVNVCKLPVPWPITHFHRNAVRRKLPMKIIKHHRDVMAFLAKSEVDPIKPLRKSTWNHSHFMWPEGGSVTLTDYCHVDVFRVGHWSNMWYLDQIVPSWSHNKFLFHGETLKFAVPPREPCLTKIHIITNFASSGSQGISHQIYVDLGGLYQGTV